MARDITVIRQQVIDTYTANAAAVGIVITPSVWSETDIEKLFCDVVAYCWWLAEKFFDTLKIEIDDTIAKLKPHSLRWYAEKAKAFMYGYNVMPETDVYDVTGLTEAQITAAKIVKHAAVVEQLVAVGRYGLRIKAATEAAGELTQLSAPQVTALSSYFTEIKDAGVPLLITTGPADSLKLKAKVFYNPQVINSTGQRIDGSDLEPVQNKIKDYLKRLPFNGVFVLQYMEDEVQVLDGVVIFRITEASARYGILPYQSIDIKYIPDAGYLRLIDNADLELEFIAQNVIK